MSGEPARAVGAATIRFERVPQLDGLRGIAILLVLIYHGAVNYPNNPFKFLGTLGGLGVMLFFVLSGFLITSILRKEQANTGVVDIRGFYAKRALRLFPALALFLGSVMVLMIAGLTSDVNWKQLLIGIFYLRDIFGSGLTLGHLWSLGIEEQFYLLWPLMLLLVPRKRLLPVAFGIATLVCLSRMTAMHLRTFDYDTGIYYMRPWFRADSILAGCCIALAKENYAAVIRRAGAYVPAGAIWAAMLAWTFWGEHLLPGSFYLGVQLILATAGVAKVVSNEDSSARSVLTQSWLRYVGRISYSLYLWQQLFLVAKQQSWGWIREFPMDIILSVVLAALSYRYVELPFLALKDRLSKQPRTTHELSSVSSSPAPAITQAERRPGLPVG
jgi:peptidoglycan/LPS O-acetylase OafA/YrhL